MASMLRKIPGIGDYTSGAIASIAFKEVGSFCDCASIKKMLFLMLYVIRWYLLLMEMW